MHKKKVPVDFVKWLQSQIKAFRARRFRGFSVVARSSRRADVSCSPYDREVSTVASCSIFTSTSTLGIDVSSPDHRRKQHPSRPDAER